MTFTTFLIANAIPALVIAGFAVIAVMFFYQAKQIQELNDEI